ncbi:hypothetical protein ACEWY4_024484 [Coilia grayii]|uniref:Reverse transcriptase domain-containing protein n=1 Tax=Coilia grayii TaxID=363190 RepID=A0ABD1J0E9_9TELE
MPMRRAAFFLSLRDGGFDVLFLQECHVGGEEDVRALQEGWTGGPSVWGGGNVRADGVGILFRGWDFTMHVVWEVVAGRVLCVDAGWRGVQLRLINVYAPCVPGERRRVFAEVAPLLHTSRLVVLGGDFNSSLDTAPSGDLGGLVGGLPLVDAFRVAGDGSPGFTWRNSRGQASRLDYLFVSAGVGVRGFVLQPLWLSDHCLIGAQLDVGEQQRRRSRGPWRFNASFLGDPSFCRVFRQLYAGWRALRPMYSSVCAWWEGVKARIATFCSEWGREKVRDARRMVERWAAELRGLWGAGSAPSAAQTERMRLLRSHLRDFYMAEARALVGLGGGSRWAPEEGPSKAFYASLRQRRSRTCLGTLRGPAGLVTEPGEVMEVARSFYADLFAQQDTDPCAAAGFLDWLGPALPELDSLSLEGDITLSEAEAAMATLSEGKAPGCDGLPVEFYRAFWDLLGADLVAVFSECSSVGRLPASMRTGLVTLLYKGRGDREALTCWRPITLLTADYKILAKVLTLRLGRVIGLVVHPDQTCGVPGRSCALNLALVRDVVCWSEQRGLSAALLSLDQEKAFDRVDHRFLFQVLRHMGFGPGFCRWVRLLYGGAVSRLRIGGCLSAPVAQRGGVRQGCPLSPLLYVLYIEPLVARLRGDPAVRGVHLPGAGGLSAKVTAFADDLTLFLTTEGSFRAVVAILAAFGQAAGAKVNLAKSAVLCLGGWGARTSVPGPFSVQQSVRILGLDFTRLESAQHNWNALLGKVTRTLSLWGTRPLSLSGRVLLVKSGILPRLNHVGYVFPVPFLTGRRLERAVFSFIWGGRTEHVSRAVMYGAVGVGGRGVPCLPLKVLCLHVAFQARLVVGAYDHPAAFLVRHWLGFALRALRPLSSRTPWSWDHPWHCARVADFLGDKGWAFEGSAVLEHRRLYAGALQRDILGSAPVLRGRWRLLQPAGLSAGAGDLAWLAALDRLPVRERMHRLWGRGPDSCVLGCGVPETVSHVFWGCREARAVWDRVSAWLGAWGAGLVGEAQVLWGEGLSRARGEKRCLLSVVLAETKKAIWQRRASCLGRQFVHGSPTEVFFRARWGVRSAAMRRRRRGGRDPAGSAWAELFPGEGWGF